jgi:phage tail-like protein
MSDKAAKTERKDPYLAFCFKVTLDAVDGFDNAVGFFKSAGGLKSETEVIDYREGGLNNTTHKLLGATKWGNIVLKRGFGDKSLSAWRQSWLDPVGKKRVTGKIEQLDTKGGTLATWTFTEAFPAKWEISEYDAGKSEVSIETLEIAHEGLTAS